MKSSMSGWSSVDNHHLGRARGGAAGLDRAGRPVANLEEGHEAGGFAAARKPLALSRAGREKLEPVPEPYLNRRASRATGR